MPSCQSHISKCQGSGGVKSLYLPIPGTYYFTSATPGACSGGPRPKLQLLAALQHQLHCYLSDTEMRMADIQQCLLPFNSVRSLPDTLT